MWSPRAGLRPLVRRLLRIHRPDERKPRTGSGTPPARCAKRLSNDDPWDMVRRARHIDRPSTMDYLNLAFDDFCELNGDRCFGNDPAVVGGPARIAGRRVMVIGNQKGHTTSDRMGNNFGMAHPGGYRKAHRLMDYAASLRLPRFARSHRNPAVASSRRYDRKHRRP